MYLFLYCKKICCKHGETQTPACDNLNRSVCAVTIIFRINMNRRTSALCTWENEQPIDEHLIHIQYVTESKMRATWLWFPFCVVQCF